MSLEGLRLTALYSYGCDNMWLHSGFSDKALKTINDFLFSGRNKQEDILRVRTILEKLEAYRDYKVIAKDNDITDPFDRRVVRAYWLGEIFGQKTGHFHNRIIFEKLSFFLDEKGQVPKIVANAALDCLVLPAQVKKVKFGKIKVSLSTIAVGKTFLEAEIEEKVENRFISDIAKDEFVSVHLGIAREKISVAEAVALMQRTVSSFRNILGFPLGESVLS